MSGPEFGIVVHGDPAPQGSKRHVGNGRMIEMSRKVKPWRAAVATAARLDIQAITWACTSSPVRVTVVFTFDRPAKHYRTGAYAGSLRPDATRHPGNRSTGDLDQCVRSTLDALVRCGPRCAPSCAQHGGVIVDDSQVVELRASKRWAGEGLGLDVPGAVIRVQVLRDVSHDLGTTAPTTRGPSGLSGGPR